MNRFTTAARMDMAEAIDWWFRVPRAGWAVVIPAGKTMDTADEVGIVDKGRGRAFIGPSFADALVEAMLDHPADIDLLAKRWA